MCSLTYAVGCSVSGKIYTISHNDECRSFRSKTDQCLAEPTKWPRRMLRSSWAGCYCGIGALLILLVDIAVSFSLYAQELSMTIRADSRHEDILFDKYMRV